VLQEKQVTPLGGGKPIPVEFTLVCATHRNLKADIDQGRFRTDLYYRINGLALVLPALRERSDFASLATRMIDEFSGRADVALEASLIGAFARYAWPGNLRQLANVLRTAVAMLDEHENLIGWQHLPDDLQEELQLIVRPSVSPLAGDVPDDLRAQSDAAIQRVVADSAGNMSEAARRLGVSRSTLYRRLRQSTEPQTFVRP
jgi:transcriptional regulator of acetoin/glycerol metabolism